MQTLEPEADAVNFADITARLEKAGWITDIHFETADGLTMDWTHLGRERIAQIEKVAAPIVQYMRDKTNPKPGLLSQLWIVFKLRPFLKELQPPQLSADEINKVLAFVIVYGPF